MADKTLKGGIEIFEKMKFPQIKRKKPARSIVCKKAGKIVARFPSVDMAAQYIAPRANFSEKYVRNSIYGALKTGTMFPPFSDYFWEEEYKGKNKGTFVTFEPEDLKRDSPFIKEERLLKVAEPKKKKLELD